MRKYVYQKNFAELPNVAIQRSRFDRSSNLTTAFDSGYLVPIYVDEVLPGDTFDLTASIFCRLTTPVTPIMDNLHLETFWFYVPNRLLWEHWEDFIGQTQETVSGVPNATAYTIPQIDLDVYGQFGDLRDYMGVPPNVETGSVNALPFRAYNLIYNEWFRDENLQEEVHFYKGDSAEDFSVGDPASAGSVINYGLLRRNKVHDYFTSALPWPQKGPGVQLPLGSVAPVMGNGMALGLLDGSGTHAGLCNIINGSFRDLQAKVGSYGADVGDTAGNSWLAGNEAIGVTKDSAKSGLVADLSSATAADINSIRMAFQLQRLYERDARGGSRYKELLLSHFGVTAPDQRLQRPELLGGSSSLISINQIAQTSSTDATSPQGNLAAFGIHSQVKHGFTKSFVEHGYVIGLVNVRSDLRYQQGLPRHFSRKTRFDYMWPTLAHLGEQAILNKEIYFQGDSVTESDGTIIDDEVFGYQERYAEYRYKPSMITGKMRSTASDSLDVWHCAEEFGNLPKLNSAFIESVPPLDRVLAVTNQPQLKLDCYFKQYSVRPLPMFGTPGLVDHF